MDTLKRIFSSKKRVAPAPILTTEQRMVKDIEENTKNRLKKARQLKNDFERDVYISKRQSPFDSGYFPRNLKLEKAERDLLNLNTNLTQLERYLPEDILQNEISQYLRPYDPKEPSRTIRALDNKYGDSYYGGIGELNYRKLTKPLSSRERLINSNIKFDYDASQQGHNREDIENFIGARNQIYEDTGDIIVSPEF